MKSTIQKVQVIINPAAGKDVPILNTLNRVFREYGISWQAAVTHEPGDATRLAQIAVTNGVDVVAGYGGDGTLMEVANGLIGSGTPLAILPGGTGNGIAKELGIPTDLERAVELICRDPKIRQIDLGRVDDRYFLLHAYIGLRKSQRANRQMKDRLGILAYAIATLRVMTDPQPSRFSLSVDGAEIEEEGIVCLVTNANALGISLPAFADIDPQNGVLNLFVIRKDALTVLRDLFNFDDITDAIKSWQGRKITLDAEPSQEIWIDGELAGQTPCTIEVVPEVLHVVVDEDYPRASTSK